VGSVDECFRQIDLAAIAEVFRQPSKQPFEYTLAHPLLVPTVTRLIRRKSSRQIRPWGTGAQHPQHRVHDWARILKRATSLSARPL